MARLAMSIHCCATTLRILADKLEQNVADKDMEELIKHVGIVNKVSSDLMDLASGRQVQQKRKQKN